MRKLERDPNGPRCLKRYRHGRDQWDQVTSEEKAAIWEKLDAMQGRRCAYCEDAIKDGERHIEHFRQCFSYRQGTFDWANLFGSCNRENSCGKHKDRCGTYDPAALIKPDVDDPEHFFLFVSDGTIAIRADLSDAEERRRAEETLRIFNLNGPLRHKRWQAVAKYVQISDEISELPKDERGPFLESELAETAHLPFATAIKHTLCRL
ncbi:retron Ec78 anti-phage system effector HNH endonuclease PtuB [Methylomagnum sp.]